MLLIKDILKRTFLYRVIASFGTRKQHLRWTAHDQEMLEFYRHVVGPGTLCFDVGANVGNRVKVFLRLAARVVAVEPQDECARRLRALYGANPHMTVVQAAVGESEGEAELMISNANTLSSVSKEWIEAVRKSGRFSGYRWNKRQLVPMTTLDKLIEQYGAPSFIKIDVEGLEYQVIKGLSRPIATLSLEFTPEYLDSTFKCFEHLQRLGEIRLNYSQGETMRFALGEWVSPEQMVGILSGLRGDSRIFGDVYVRFPKVVRRQ